MGTLQELRQRLIFLQQTVGEIVQQFKHLSLSLDEAGDCLNILDNAKVTFYKFDTANFLLYGSCYIDIPLVQTLRIKKKKKETGFIVLDIPLIREL